MKLEILIAVLGGIAIIAIGICGVFMLQPNHDLLKLQEESHQNALKVWCLQNSYNGDLAWKQKFCYELITGEKQTSP